MQSTTKPSGKVGFTQKLKDFRQNLLNKRIQKKNSKEKGNYLSKESFFYEEYFDLIEGKDSVEFDNYPGRFDPRDSNYFVYDIINKENGQKSLKFFFDGRMGQWYMGAHYLLQIRYVGIIVCDEILDFVKGDYSGDNVSFNLKKDPLDSSKILEIENNEVGRVYIKCNKLYARELNAYTEMGDGKWKKLEDWEENFEVDNIEGIFATYNIEISLKRELSGLRVNRYIFEFETNEDREKFISVADDLFLALRSYAKFPMVYKNKPNDSEIIVEVQKDDEEILYFNDCIPNIPKNIPIPIIIGEDIQTRLLIKDLKGLKNILLAGHTRTGKSVFLNSVISTILLTKSPEEVQLVLIDTKMYQFDIYDGVPHLKYPVFTDIKEATDALGGLLYERQQIQMLEKLPEIVVVIDEYADLIELDEERFHIYMNILSNGYKYGIYTILSSSKVSDNEFLKRMREKVPVKLVGSLANIEDSIEILGEKGAENLLGSGDMFFKDADGEKVRIQTPWISYEEIKNIVKNFKEDNNDDAKVYGKKITETKEDELYNEAIKLKKKYKSLTTQILQRELNIGYNRAQRIIERINNVGK